MEETKIKTTKHEFDELNKKYHKQLLNTLKQRGWALYEVGPAGTIVTSENDIATFVLRGSEKESLKENVAYEVLPHIEDDSNWEAMRQKMAECISKGRYPFWVDMSSRLEFVDVEDEEKRGEEERIVVDGVYLIDTIVYNRPFYELVIDYQLMNNLNIITENNKNIMLDVNDIYKMLKQLTLCDRK